MLGIVFENCFTNRIFPRALKFRVFWLMHREAWRVAVYQNRFLFGRFQIQGEVPARTSGQESPHITDTITIQVNHQGQGTIDYSCFFRKVAQSNSSGGLEHIIAYLILVLFVRMIDIVFIVAV